MGTKVTFISPIKNVRGGFGDIVFKRFKSGKTIISQKPKRNMSIKPFTEDEEASQNRFREAQSFANSIYAQPEALERYRIAFESQNPKKYQTLRTFIVGCYYYPDLRP